MNNTEETIRDLVNYYVRPSPWRITNVTTDRIEIGGDGYSINSQFFEKLSEIIKITDTEINGGKIIIHYKPTKLDIVRMILTPTEDIYETENEIHVLGVRHLTGEHIFKLKEHGLRIDRIVYGDTVIFNKRTMNITLK